MNIAPQPAPPPLRIPKDRPVYRLSEPFFDPHDQWHPEGKIIAFEGTPNQGMVPLNERAIKAYDQYLDRLDAGKKLFCEKSDPPVHFVPHARVYDEPELDIPDVSKNAVHSLDGGNQPTLKLGSSKKTGHAAEGLN